MNKLNSHHILQYLLLATVAVFFIVMLDFFQGQRTAQFIVITLFVLFYITWGILHHVIDRSLHLKVVLEYILFGAIGFFLLQILLLR